MRRLGRFPHAQSFPASSARGLIFLAVLVLPGHAYAVDAPGASNTQPVDPAVEEQKARERFEKIEWEAGPGVVDLGDVAELKLCDGFMFTSPEGGTLFMELNENPPPKHLLGILAPLESIDWFVIFEYHPGEKRHDHGGPDADAILRTLRQDDEAANAIRRSRGQPECQNLAWELPPSYQGSSGNLTWATRFDIGGERCVNYTTRVFGRSGAIDAQLVADPKELAKLMPTVTNLLSLLEFKDALGPGGLHAGEGPDGDESAAADGRDATGRRRSSATARWSLWRWRRLIGGLLTGVAIVIGRGLKKY